MSKYVTEKKTELVMDVIFFSEFVDFLIKNNIRDEEYFHRVFERIDDCINILGNGIMEPLPYIYMFVIFLNTTRLYVTETNLKLYTILKHKSDNINERLFNNDKLVYYIFTRAFRKLCKHYGIEKYDQFLTNVFRIMYTHFCTIESFDSLKQDYDFAKTFLSKRSGIKLTPNFFNIAATSYLEYTILEYILKYNPEDHIISKIYTYENIDKFLPTLKVNTKKHKELLQTYEYEIPSVTYTMDYIFQQYYDKIYSVISNTGIFVDIILSQTETISKIYETYKYTISASWDIELQEYERIIKTVDVKQFANKFNEAYKKYSNNNIDKLYELYLELLKQSVTKINVNEDFIYILEQKFLSDEFFITKQEEIKELIKGFSKYIENKLLFDKLSIIYKKLRNLINDKDYTLDAIFI